MPFGILVVHRILAIQVRQSEFVIYSTAPVLQGGVFVALMLSGHVPCAITLSDPIGDELSKIVIVCMIGSLQSYGP